MPILNYTTTVEVAKTMGEIQAALARRGVKRISTLFDDDGVPAGLGFTMQTDYGVQEFQLPVRTDGVLAAMKRDAKVPATKCTPEQAARVAWRIAKDWLEAQAALIDAGLATLDEVMMPYMLVAPDRTAYIDMRHRFLAIEGGADGG
ncbi:hypothetical protein [Curtobacterium sp. CFBP9011]|uniref:hypothetical protein n=1 Tax=Curtobacterium sp. CFBP9011 TaxID=3096530 RepID=UPI002A6B6DAC|nr:hypothetical protein [Curtobacterium sp. CFBP9011]MDY1005731.1 hypothetical protein [Curtobacterium sp. CFBP9011]